jgi:hypothetical protein
MALKLSGREYFLLGVLIVAAGFVLFWRDGGPLFERSEDGKARAAALGDAPLVHWDRLVAEPEAYDPGGRNLFQYYTPPPPRTAPQRIERPVARKAPPPRPQPRRVTTPTTTGQTVRPPTVSFKYLGFLGPKDDKIAVFEKGQELELVRVGEIVQKDFRLVDFKYEGVVIGYVDERFADQTTELRMSR